MFWIDDDAAFSFSYLLFIFIIYILTGWKIKVTAKWGLDILRIHCQNSAFIMTNGIGNFRQGVDIFDKRILDSILYVYIRQYNFEYGLVYSNLFHGADRA